MTHLESLTTISIVHKPDLSIELQAIGDVSPGDLIQIKGSVYRVAYLDHFVNNPEVWKAILYQPKTR